MPRPVEFDRKTALHDAMLLFWRQGYYQTSVRDLTEATRLQPGSLYGAFQSKRALFLKSLDHYSQALRTSVDAILRSDARPLARIHRFFDHLLAEQDRDRQQKGCLLVNTLLEMPAEDAEVRDRAAGALAYVEDTFAEVLEDARCAGELPGDADPGTLAKLLMTGIFGLRVYAKTQPPPGTLAAIAKNLLRVLEQH